MDRIRNAVIRARGAGQAPEARAADETASTAPVRFARIACDPDALARNRVVANEQDPTLNAYRVLRTRILQKMDERGWRSLAIVSPGAAAGKTVTAINLSIAIGSRAGAPALLADFDFYRPRVAQYLGFQEPPPSAIDYLEGAARLEDVVVQPEAAHLLVLANERLTRRGAELLSSRQVDELVERGVGEFGARAVVFDMSPLLGCDDTLALLPKIDCALVVATSGKTRAADLKETLRVLDGKPIVGTVLNQAPTPLRQTAYYY